MNQILKKLNSLISHSKTNSIKEIYINQLPINLIVMILILFYTFFLSSIPVTQFKTDFFFILFGDIIIFTALDLIFNSILTNSLSNEILHWEETGLSIGYRKTLLKKVLKYPFNKSVGTQFIYHVVGAITVLQLYFNLNIDKKIIEFFIISYMALVYVYIMIIFSNTEYECKKIACMIVAQGVEIKKTEFFFGLSSKTLFFLQIILPLIFSQLFTLAAIKLSQSYIVVHMNGYVASTTLSTLEEAGLFVKKHFSTVAGIPRVIFVTFTNITCCFTLIYLYFKNFHQYMVKMSKTLNGLINGSLTKSSYNIDVDLSNENSYTLYLIKKTLVLIDSLMLKNTDNNEMLTTSSSELYELSKETEENIISQTKKIETILAIMQSISIISREIIKKIDEAVNVSSKSLNNVDIIFKDLSENISKMQQITDANMETISSLVSLSKKISNIQSIVNIIDNVAEQTKTIAFNTELESNKIDTKNTNFTEVAQEIRSLTNFIIDLTKKIRNQIHDITLASDELIISGNTCMRKTKQGNNICSQLEEKFLKIKTSAQKTVQSSKLVKNNVYEQNQIFSQIIDTLNEIRNNVSDFKEDEKSISTIIDSLKESSLRILALNNQYTQANNMNNGE